MKHQLMIVVIYYYYIRVSNASVIIFVNEPIPHMHAKLATENFVTCKLSVVWIIYLLKYFI